RRYRALRAERPLPLLDWLQSDRSDLDGDRFLDLYLCHPDCVDSSLADATDHGRRLPADRLGRAARQDAQPGLDNICIWPGSLTESSGHAPWWLPRSAESWMTQTGPKRRSSPCCHCSEASLYPLRRMSARRSRRRTCKRGAVDATHLWGRQSDRGVFL